MDRMQELVERKLKGEIARKDRDLRRVLGHFDMLERVNSRSDEAEFAQSRTDNNNAEAKESGLHVQNMPHDKEETSTHWNEWSDLDKDMIVIEGIEVDEADDDDDDTVSSDDGSLSDQDELPEYDDVHDFHSVHIEDEACHSPPSYVEDVTNDLGKMSLQPIFEETTCEVSEDD